MPNSDAEYLAYQTHFNLIAALMGKMTMLQMRRIYKEFNGDLLLAMILIEIAQYNIEDILRNEQDICLDYDQLVRDGSRKRINTLSLSQATGIPRETLRRKIDLLIKMNWLDKDKHGYLSYTKQCVEHFEAGVNYQQYRELVDCVDQIKHLTQSKTD